MTAKRRYRLLPAEGGRPTPGATLPAEAPPGEPIDPGRRRAMIAETAYFRAARRGFVGGDPIADWLEAEREVDARLARETPHDESSATARRTQT